MATCSVLLVCHPSQSRIALILRAFIFVLLPLYPSSYCTPLQAPHPPASSANASRILVSKDEHLANTSAPFSHLHQTASESLEELKARSNHSSSRPGGHYRTPAGPTYNLASCSTGNTIDDCWRCDPNWQANRKKLADCAIGFGRAATGGKHGKVYTVIDAGNDDPVTPKPGTLRHAVIQEEPLWIIFASDMTILCRHGFFEVVNNDYLQWGMYAIGGSAAPTIISRGNRFTAPTDRNAKEVTMRIDTPKSQWDSWDWQSEGYMFLNGAYFTASGKSTSTNYKKAASIGPKASSLVPILTANAGALTCKAKISC